MRHQDKDHQDFNHQHEAAASSENMHCSHCNTSKEPAYVFTEWGACLDCIDQHRST